MTQGGKERRQQRLGKNWLDAVAELRRRGMTSDASKVGYIDDRETFGKALMAECERAAPVALGWKTPPKGPGISRGKSRSLSANRSGDK